MRFIWAKPIPTPRVQHHAKAKQFWEDILTNANAELRLTITNAIHHHRLSPITTKLRAPETPLAKMQRRLALSQDMRRRKRQSGISTRQTTASTSQKFA